ncbi:MAG: SusC/RagA family TonB-linked outer membrane protein [Paludibacteraceae bacterium]|nr:SusC/RagA family TonB-linked outer membrane protein [Paludibacteraceae bacterium]
MKKSNFNMFRTISLVMMLTLGSLVAFAQTTASGTVVDAANGEPIIGASILEMGTTNGTITDFDGNFSLKVQPGAKLQISYMGYKTQELPAAAGMAVKLGEDSELLDEVVVVGYGVVKKNDATGSVTAIKPDDMNKGLQTNAQDMIQGKIAGVNVSTDGGAPGGGAAIRIRGGSSLNASNNPLIVIDGLAMDNNGIQGVSNPLSLVNPADIETFTVLKDASATAIYGSRASNGVILITTKKGKAGSKLKVSYDGNVSFGSVLKHLNVLTGDELRAYATAAGQSAKANYYLMNDNVDWFSQIYRTSVSTDHNVSLMGGVKNKIVDMPYRASIGYTLNNGAVRGSQMQRVTASLNLNPSFLDNHLIFNLNAKGMYIYNKYEPGIAGAYLDKDPTQPIYSTGDLTNIDGNPILAGVTNGVDYYITKEELDAHWGGFFQPLGTSSSQYGPYDDPYWMYSLRSSANPLAQLAHQSNTSNAGQFVGNLDATYKIHGFEDLVLHANFGADYSFGKQVNDNSPFGSASHYTGWHGVDQKMKYNLQFNCYAQYGHDWEQAQQHFDIMAGYEWQHFYNEYEGWGNGMYPDTYMGDPAKAGKPANAFRSTGKGENYLVSFFGRLNWIGWNQVMLTATIRGDGSSRFSRDHRWGVFPSVALGWKIKETFLKDVNEVDDLKLRLGYGITGQQEGIGDYSYMPSYSQTTGHTSYYPVGGENYATEDFNTNIVDKVVDADGNVLFISDRPNAFNPNLTWEKTTTYNAGIDFSFLNNRISGSLDYYFRYTTDLLNNVNAPMGTNFRKRVMSNVGSLQNQGIEFAINAVILDYGKKFKWDLGYNFTWNENKITKINGEEMMIDGSGYGGAGLSGKSITKYAVGYATDVFYLYESRKGTRDDGSQYWYIVDQQAEGEEGHGKIDEQDKVFKQSPVAPFTMGFQMKFQFYNFDLGMSFRANIGNYVFNNVISTRLQNVAAGNLARDGYYKNLPTDVFNTYYKDGYNMTIYDEAGSTIIGNAEYDITDRFLENASFLRCDNITLGYSFAKNKISGRAFCTVSNPFVITKYTGLDPEVGLGGVDNSIYPRSMTTVLGINLQF